jgi:hypothetical protein
MQKGRGVSQNKLFVSFVKKLKKMKEIDLLCTEDVENPLFLPNTMFLFSIFHE